MKNYNSRKIITVTTRVTKQKKSPQRKNNPPNKIEPINHKSEKLSNLLFKKESSNFLNSENKSKIQNKNNQKYLTQKKIKINKYQNNSKAILQDKISSHSIEDNLKINKLSSIKNEKNFFNKNYNIKSSAYNLNLIKNDISKNFNLNESQSNDSSAFFRKANISQGEKNISKSFNNQTRFKNEKNSPKNYSNNNFQRINSKFLFKKQETKQIKTVNKEESKIKKQKIISPTSNNYKNNCSNKGIPKNNNLNVYKKKIITDEKLKNTNKLSKKSTKLITQKTKNSYGVQEKNSDNSKNKTKESNTTNYENNKKISDYNNTASNFENSQNKLSEINNSNNKCNNSENFQVQFLVSGFNKFNFSEQNQKELEYLLKGNPTQTKKSLFSEHMNFLINQKESKFQNNKNNNKMNKGNYINEKLFENFLEPSDKMQQQDVESKFINYNLGITTDTFLTKESLFLSFSKNNIIKNLDQIKNNKFKRIKINENNNEKQEDSFLINKDKYLNNINEFEGGENIQKINNIVFNKFI